MIHRKKILINFLVLLIFTILFNSCSLPKYTAIEYSYSNKKALLEETKECIKKILFNENLLIDTSYYLTNQQDFKEFKIVLLPTFVFSEVAGPFEVYYYLSLDIFLTEKPNLDLEIRFYPQFCQKAVYILACKSLPDPTEEEIEEYSMLKSSLPSYNRVREYYYNIIEKIKISCGLSSIKHKLFIEDLGKKAEKLE